MLSASDPALMPPLSSPPSSGGFSSEGACGTSVGCSGTSVGCSGTSVGCSGTAVGCSGTSVGCSGASVGAGASVGCAVTAAPGFGLVILPSLSDRYSSVSGSATPVTCTGQGMPLWALIKVWKLATAARVMSS